MKKIGKILSMGMTLVCSLACAIPAFADGTAVSGVGGTGETPVSLTADATAFSVTVPTSIPIKVNADASVTCPSASAVKITNNCAGAIKVSKIEMRDSAWGLVSYDGGDRNVTLSSKPVDSKLLGFRMTANGDNADTAANGDQILAHDATKWVINPRTATESGNLEISTSAIATAVSEAIEASDNVTAANVVFTIGWNEA